MDKRKNHSIAKIAILGAESTGKTTLCLELSKMLPATAVFEYARDYMTSSEVTYDELVHIAEEQIKSEDKAVASSTTPYILFDTEIINLKIWFEYVFQKVPDFLSDIDIAARYDFYLITQMDLDYEVDPLRKYTDPSIRQALESRYIEEVKRLNIPYGLVHGDGEERTELAYKLIKENTDI